MYIKLQDRKIQKSLHAGMNFEELLLATILISEFSDYKEHALVL